jgi:FlaA1/EpsC-like NDP-sugar epimerase
MRGRGAALIVGMRAGERRAEAAQEQQQQQQAAQQQAYDQGKQEAQQPAAKPASSGGDVTAQLNQLAQMHASGQLSDEEYAAAKKKLLS